MNAVLAALLATFPLLTGLASTGQSDKPIRVQLTGVEEAPNPGDTDGSGTAHVTINAAEICYEIRVTDIDLPAAGAHIHKAPPGEPGPVAVIFQPPEAGGHVSGCTPVEKALTNDIRKNPGDYYINIQTTSYPTGALRGQMGAYKN
jgi:hypothetical protein